MASTTAKLERQQLGELLQQQQEPFVLELYLIERGYLKKSLSSRLQSSRFGCCNVNPNKFSTKSIPSCSKILRALLKKLSHRNERSHAQSEREAKFSVTETKRNGQQFAERERFSSASSTTVFNSCSESDKDESPFSSSQHYDSVIADTLEGLRLSSMTEEEACTGREFQYEFMANNKQHSPVSVLEQTSLSSKFSFRAKDQESETTCTVSKIVAEDTKLSASMCQLCSQSNLEKSMSINGSVNFDYDPMKLIGSNDNPSPQFVKSKRMLQQTRQLLFDCVREIVESHAIGNEQVKRKCHKGVFGPEELGNLLLERMMAWDKQGGDEPNSHSSLLNLDIFDFSLEWSRFEFEKSEICARIGDAIADGLMSEIVIEAMDL